MRARVNPGFLIWLLLGVVPISLAASGKGNPATGQKLYLENCQNCHGPAGKGDSDMAAYLAPAPANLTAKATQEKTDAQLRKVIQEGRPGTAMTGYAVAFDEEKLDDMIAYIRSLKPFEPR
ncbi:MAG: Cytochrome c oxidase subunit CcoP [Nitrospira sp.]|nr:MAG: Cytochrome c oxidase subunit CcoP [Nitrospira sp.]